MTAQTAAERLAEALAAAEHRGDSVPCRRGDDAWLSEDLDDRREAARRCLGCCVITLCAAAADEHREKFGVWAGVDRTPRPRRRAGAA